MLKNYIKSVCNQGILLGLTKLHFRVQYNQTFFLKYIFLKSKTLTKYCTCHRRSATGGLHKNSI